MLNIISLDNTLTGKHHKSLAGVHKVGCVVCYSQCGSALPSTTRFELQSPVHCGGLRFNESSIWQVAKVGLLKKLENVEDFK